MYVCMPCDEKQVRSTISPRRARQVASERELEFSPGEVAEWRGGGVAEGD
jgi:hypothetical protein